MGYSVQELLITHVKPGNSISSCFSVLLYACLLEENNVLQEQFTRPLPCLSRNSSCIASSSSMVTSSLSMVTSSLPSMVTSLSSEPLRPSCSYSDLFPQSFDSLDRLPLCLSPFRPLLLQWPCLPLVLLKISSESSFSTPTVASLFSLWTLSGNWL